jgi:hypothetical protein
MQKTYTYARNFEANTLTQNGAWSSCKLHTESESLRETAKVLRVEAERLREISRAVRAGEYI